MQHCDAKCQWCARQFWKWLKAREHQMSTPHKGSGTSFAEAARTSVSRKLALGSTMLWRGRVATVLNDSGNPGLDGRHWVFVELESKHPVYEAWKLHVPREELQ